MVDSYSLRCRTRTKGATAVDEALIMLLMCIVLVSPALSVMIPTALWCRTKGATAVDEALIMLSTAM